MNNMKNTKNTKQYLTAISAMTLRDLIKTANAYGIVREQVVQIMKEGETFLLMYYREAMEEN